MSLASSLRSRSPYSWYTPARVPVLNVIVPLGGFSPRGSSHHSNSPKATNPAAAPCRARRPVMRVSALDMGEILPAGAGC